MRHALPAVSALALMMACSSAQAGDPAAPDIDAARMNEAVRVLASDEFQGRAPASPGEEKTVAWLVEQFRAAGAEGGGPDGAFVQIAHLSRTRQDGPATIAAQVGGRSIALERGPDVLVSSDRPTDHIAVTDAPVVFVGYGATAPERQWDDFKDVDVRGKVLIVLVNDPDFEAPAGDPVAGKFDDKAMTFYGRWTYKFLEAGRRGAAGVLVVHETAGAGYGWSVLQNSSAAPKFDIVRADPNAERAPFQGWIQRAKAEELFTAAGLDFAALKDSARSADFKPVVLPGMTMNVDFGQIADRVETKNLIARIPGSERPNETVMYGAHWDGYGVGTPDASGDTIYNAAVDNATGVAALLELAHAFADAPRPKRSVVFAAWSGEEAGLLGSTYYAANPVWPLETTVANINVDSLLPGTEIDPNVVVIGKGKNQLDEVLARHATATGRTLIADPAPQAGAFYRSDHFPLALKGVPALFPAAGFTGASAASRDYVQNRYHQPSDAWDATWRMDAAAADVALIYAVGRDLAQSDVWPEWNPGAEFGPARDQSKALRP
ncbi:MAG: M28 family peptidase [Alphaproteobacteria bacterium]|uniref:M28 family metallopeptidase n=1 Tax=Brevundimonas sp. TaxID=1871086 RepID=UPI0025BBA922|nr:M28 family metallopeptidase [Brevundimonas sp.]MBU4195292.1 M28 family peptidase [Alphaproteobacteria bacterium]MBU4238964.1 M28 family peptidase [Alphaproteobacteria bacterium]MCG2663785.1 M28 family metallopeptidase [Brevundimonas sp.]